MIISIPSRGRVGRQITLQQIPADWVSDVHFWCPEEEIETHKQYPYAGKIGHFHAAPLGIAASRQAQVDYARSIGLEWIWFCDDDLTFSRRPSDQNTTKKITDDDSDMWAMGGRLVSFTEAEYRGCPIAIIGISMRRYLHHPEETETYTHIIQRCWALRVPVLFKEGIRFDSFGPEFSIEDYHVRLSLAKKGYAGVCLTDFMHTSESNAPGGCAIYRDNQGLFQQKCVDLLAKEHPGLVRIGKGRGEWNSVNPICDWEKALNPDKSAVTSDPRNV